jgi:hypothetical protein
MEGVSLNGNLFLLFRNARENRVHLRQPTLIVSDRQAEMTEILHPETRRICTPTLRIERPQDQLTSHDNLGHQFLAVLEHRLFYLRLGLGRRTIKLIELPEWKNETTVYEVIPNEWHTAASENNVADQENAHHRIVRVQTPALDEIANNSESSYTKHP